MNDVRRQKSRLRWLLAGVFGVLLIPCAALVFLAFNQLRWESFHSQRLLAESLATRIDRDISQIILSEDARTFSDYSFLVLQGERYVARSKLSSLPPDTQLPGVVGYFQMDTDGRLSTPWLPADPLADGGLSERERQLREQSQQHLQALLTAGAASSALPPPVPAPDSARDPTQMLGRVANPAFLAPKEASKEAAKVAAKVASINAEIDAEKDSAIGEVIVTAVSHGQQRAAPVDAGLQAPSYRTRVSRDEERQLAQNQALFEQFKSKDNYLAKSRSARLQPAPPRSSAAAAEPKRREIAATSAEEAAFSPASSPSPALDSLQLDSVFADRADKRDNAGKAESVAGAPIPVRQHSAGGVLGKQKGSNDAPAPAERAAHEGGQLRGLSSGIPDGKEQNAVYTGQRNSLRVETERKPEFNGRNATADVERSDLPLYLDPAVDPALHLGRDLGRDLDDYRARTDKTTESDTLAPSPLRIELFRSELEPMVLARFDDTHLVLFRNVWRDSKRFVQGALIDQHAFLNQTIAAHWRDTTLPIATDLVVGYAGHVLTTFAHSQDSSYSDYSRSTPADIAGELLLRTRLSPPAGDLELIFSISSLPLGPGATTVGWTASILLVLLASALALIYRVGCKQIDLVQERQDFVSAVSHELKTPLTSIRMYGEILRAGWASDEKRTEYYDYIFFESERLTRLINNVLQLARLGHRTAGATDDSATSPATVGSLVDQVRSSVHSSLYAAGFSLEVQAQPEDLKRLVQVNVDTFTQVMINLVDNAIKFSHATEHERGQIIVLGARYVGKAVEFSIRDHGPGIARDQLKKIFRLFYRTENELTRETVGTGIGLALVKELVEAMNGSVDVVNANPGAEFRVRLQEASGEAANMSDQTPGTT